jgi:hypothetical protein
MDATALSHWLFFLGLFIFYWWFYFVSRLRRKSFLVNLVLAVVLTIMYWDWLVYPMVGSGWFYRVLLWMAILGVVAHHLSILYGRGGPRTQRVHGKISHLMYFVPVLIAGFQVSLTLFKNMESFKEASIWLLHTIVLGLSVVGGMWAAFDLKMYEKLAKRYSHFARLAEQC